MQMKVNVETDLLKVAAHAHLHQKALVHATWKHTAQFGDLCSQPPGSQGQKATANLTSFSAFLLPCHF